MLSIRKFWPTSLVRRSNICCGCYLDHIGMQFIERWAMRNNEWWSEWRFEFQPSLDERQHRDLHSVTHIFDLKPRQSHDNGTPWLLTPVAAGVHAGKKRFRAAVYLWWALPDYSIEWVGRRSERCSTEFSGWAFKNSTRTAHRENGIQESEKVFSRSAIEHTQDAVPWSHS